MTMSGFDFEWVKSVERRWSTCSEDSGVALTRCVAEIERLQHCLSDETRKREALQAQVDALMLEYCPDEMTPEQTAEWARHQRPATTCKTFVRDANLSRSCALCGIEHGDER